MDDGLGNDLVVEKATAFWNWLKKPSTLAGGAFVLCSAAFVLCTLALNAGSEDKTSDWISAFGTVFGAVITGGALLVAALTFRKQVADRHQELEDKRQEGERKRREQADKVIVRVIRGNLDNRVMVDLINSTNLPIYGMKLYVIDDDGQVIDRQPLVQDVVAGDYPGHFFEQGNRVHSAYAEFTDSGGVTWIRTSKGTLVEEGKEPAGFDPRELWQAGDPL
jgi:hypothetical protein